MSDQATNLWNPVPDWGGGVGARELVRPMDGTLGGSLWEFAPGGSQFVYHFHHGSEELLIVLRGTATVRMQDGDHTLAEGDVMPFPRGPAGGHQIRNESDSPLRVLIIAANANPDVAEYPESGKVAYVVDGNHRYHRTADSVPDAGPET
jgi:uncharacterized cupin superfamily protein